MIRIKKKKHKRRTPFFKIVLRATMRCSLEAWSSDLSWSGQCACDDTLLPFSTNDFACLRWDLNHLPMEGGTTLNG
jgi:hypothetical protein